MRWYTVNGTRLLSLLLFVLAAIVGGNGQPIAGSGVAIAASVCLLAAAIETRGLS